MKQAVLYNKATMGLRLLFGAEYICPTIKLTQSSGPGYSVTQNIYEGKYGLMTVVEKKPKATA